MVGLNKFSDKRRREMRRKNHIARDLRTPKYRQRRQDTKITKEEKFDKRKFELDLDEDSV